MVQLNQAVLKALGARWGGKMKDARITQGIRAFPDSQTTGFNVEFGGIIGRILYPFGVSFLLPVFVIVLVKGALCSKFAMMRMNGMKPWAYYLSHYVAFYLLFAVSSALFLISGRIARLSLFTKTEISILLLLFFIWGHVQIVLAFFFSALFSRSRIALVLTFLIVLCGVIISLVMDSLFPLSDPVPTAFFLWPPFAFYRILSDLNRASFSWTVPPYSFKRIEPGTEVANAFLLLTFEIFIYGIVALYLAAVVPSEFGTPRPWNFPVLAAVKYYKYRVQKKQTQPSEVLLARQISPSPGSLHEDDDVRRERQRVDDSSFPADCPIVIYHMQKVYPPRGGLGPKFAVKDVTLAVERGLVLGMLGPNGAGKTTLISILTGLYEPSGGTARLAGLDVRTQLDDVYKIIGICPQFDILWDDLTVGEHLYFYARLKGIEPVDEEAAVSRSLAKVSLSSLQHRLSKSLSGGEKRRLSIAIALVGDPTVVFLDEPTTGLDPEVRRLIWNIIREAKEGKTIVLTTHSMEEAEAVCQRIGIMAKGSMRCLGNPLRLKELYGSGFKVFFNSSQEDTARACEWVESILPKGWTKVDAFSTSTSYEFPSSPGVISQLFEHIEREKSAHGILDWGVSQTTLEEVFLRIISDADADAD
ncbi:P-loop containing nucleoside triphosphate hydrolase protein [Zopfochytrium polystomum]|nr:P-loop containing nucleoside triphosphate hydrolase protein [Zopfochytrium polystomum]